MIYFILLGFEKHRTTMNQLMMGVIIDQRSRSAIGTKQGDGLLVALLTTQQIITQYIQRNTKYDISLRQNRDSSLSPTLSTIRIASDCRCDLIALFFSRAV